MKIRRKHSIWLYHLEYGMIDEKKYPSSLWNLNAFLFSDQNSQNDPTIAIKKRYAKKSTNEFSLPTWNNHGDDDERK